jgi:glycosyltransferase involved in cell wall biosynthesis
MKLAMINRMLGFNRGGGEMWDLNIARELENLGVDVTFVIARPLFGEVPNPVDDFETIRIPTPHLKDLSYAAPKGIGGLLADIDSQFFTRRVASRLANSDHDLIHVNSDPRFGRVVFQLDRPVTIKMNGPPHSLWHDYVNPVSSSYDFFSLFDAVIATGITTPEIERHTECEVTTINPGVDTDLFHPDGESVSFDAGTTLLWVGRFVPAKNLSLLLEGFSTIHERFPDTELVLVGDGPLRDDVESEIRKRGLESAVTLKGYVPNERLPAYYRGADVFVLSSRTENHPIVLLEAMSTATPVIAPEIGYIPNMIEDGSTGLLYEGNSKCRFVDSLVKIISDKEVRYEVALQSRSVTIERFDWEVRAKQFKEIIQNTLEGCQP